MSAMDPQPGEGFRSVGKARVASRWIVRTTMLGAYIYYSTEPGGRTIGRTSREAWRAWVRRTKAELIGQ